MRESHIQLGLLTAAELSARRISGQPFLEHCKFPCVTEVGKKPGPEQSVSKVRFCLQVDRLFEWKSVANAAIQDSLGQQASHVVGEYEKNLQRAILNLNEQGLNVALYWKNPDPRKYVNIVPTSAITGEGIPDMLQLVVQLTQVIFHIMPMEQMIAFTLRLTASNAWKVLLQ